jgi:trk system potassium uptake protein TrkH
LVSLIYDDQQQLIFLISLLIPLFLGLLLYFPLRKHDDDLSLRDGFLVVALFWLVLSFFGSIPFILSDALSISVTNAVFESVSGLTTTGATILTQLDHLPKSILFYRSQLQWLGGLGIIVLAIAILPLLGVGGMQLYKAETPGPIKDNKMTPRLTQTAKALWYVYLSITVACALAYYIAGMDIFDAICHSFSTVSIGGFSTHDESFAYFNNTAIELIAILFMVISGINFSLHFLFWSKKSIAIYQNEYELVAYVVFLLTLCIFVSITLTYAQGNNYLDANLAKGVFQAISFATTTGFTVSDMSGWPSYIPMLLIVASFIGGCGGSTAGGMKVIRWCLVLKQGSREIKRLIHPQAQFPIKLGKKVISNNVIDSIWGFFSVYSLTFVAFIFLIMLSGAEYTTAFSMVAATLNNLGPGLGDVAMNYSNIPDTNKWICMLSMIMGRLEILTLLVLISPAFWRS